MNEEVIVFALIIAVVMYVIILWKFTLLGNYTNDLDNRINLLEEEFYTERLFKTDKQRFDLALQRCVKKLVNKELEKRG